MGEAIWMDFVGVDVVVGGDGWNLYWLLMSVVVFVVDLVDLVGDDIVIGVVVGFDKVVGSVVVVGSVIGSLC